MRVGIIRCNERSNSCAGYRCFPAIRNRTDAFKGYDNIELIGFETCGGCGRNTADKIVERALRLRENKAEVIHLACCLLAFCPFKDMYETAIKEKVGLPIIEGTHKLDDKYASRNPMYGILQK